MSDIYINIDAEEPTKLSKEEYAKHILKSNEVPDMTWAEEDGSKGSLPAAEVVTNLINAGLKGKDLLADANEALEPFTDLIKQINAEIKASEEFVKEQKNAKEKEKENAKKEKEEKAKALEKARSIFGDSAVIGAKQAQDDFKSELEALKDGMPDGVTIKASGEGFGVVIEEGASEEKIGQALGYLMAQEDNTVLKANVVQFLVGDIANSAFQLGLYKSMRSAGEEISEKVLKSIGKKLSPRNVESYARMARTIPSEFRNPRVDATAYLALSDAPRIFPDKLKKEEGESDSSFKKRKEDAAAQSDAYEAKRLEIAEHLAKGYIEVEVEKDGKTETVRQDLTSRKDVLPLVEKLKIEGGFKEEGDETEHKKTAADYLRQFFVATFAIENFEGVHKKGVAVFHTQESEAVTVEYTHAELVDMIEEAKNNLINIFYGDNLPKIMKGEVTLEKKKVGDDKKIVKDDKGNPVMETYTKKVYPKSVF
jgi:hypothetical protein